jgi:DNA-binding transcriptional ArsR family regulator
MSLSLLSAVSALRAAGEPSRLRLLAVLAKAELTVGELCEILGQSQPRVSRHLKVLLDAGLLDRFREEHWVYYRVPASGEAHDIVRQLLSLVVENDDVLTRDHRRMEAVIAERARRASEELAAQTRPSAEVEALVLRELQDKPIGVLLDVGTGPGYLLELLAPHASRAIGVDISTDALRLARTNVHGAGLSHCELQQGDVYDLPFPSATFDTATLDRLLATARRPALALAEVARTLKPGGRLVVIEDFDALADATKSNPITTLRQWLTAAGVECVRIHPVDTESGHLLVAVSERAAQSIAA